jgi:hypothetical protein
VSVRRGTEGVVHRSGARPTLTRLTAGRESTFAGAQGRDFPAESLWCRRERSFVGGMLHRVDQVSSEGHADPWWTPSREPVRDRLIKNGHSPSVMWR